MLCISEQDGVAIELVSSFSVVVSIILKPCLSSLLVPYT